MNTEIKINEVTECPAGCAAIRVYRGSDIPESMHWATAAMRGLIEHVATYYAPCDDDGVVQLMHIEAVERLHPGEDMWYIYL